MPIVGLVSSSCVCAAHDTYHARTKAGGDIIATRPANALPHDPRLRGGAGATPKRRLALTYLIEVKAPS